ncbi:hypothetical protein F7734_09880 [Scytonema sp. UIC 10036]|uniref:hypothetical protein n=1 Tax=Scytonema sp. UIC 10036 TaxID=2304196 RepID=UPI0012DAB6E4|nr:hypothetical protein [Scytonema sp. UIC 10036]MUG92740.1 hypothetical protein [Scytonema sp. UIC 10036]
MFQFDFLPVSISFRAAASSPACEAASIGWVAELGSSAGASFLCIRPSTRSFSQWVCCVYFGSGVAAAEFSDSVAFRCGFPFCAIRSVGEWCVVSVPVVVAEVPAVPGGLPCLYVSF